jgi:UDP-glucose 4-epimerase
LALQPQNHFRENVVTTFSLLEALRKGGNIDTFIFTSISTIYGEDSKPPTPEDYAPFKPISVYGASKLACEALVTSYDLS